MSSLEEGRSVFTVDHPEDLDVFALYYPFQEVIRARKAVELDEDFHNPLLRPSEARKLLHKGGYSFWEDLEIPTTPRGLVDFEKIHEPVTALITERNAPQLPGLSGFTNRYATHGSGEAINRLMTGWFATGKMTRLGYVNGDYPGYVGEAIGLGPMDVVGSLEEAGDPIEGRVWFLSNPSAINGNWHDDEVLRRFIEAGHDIVLDYAYGGLTTDNHPVDVFAPNIRAVFTSPSKTFGVFNHRLTGVAYTREEEASLGSTDWYKDVPDLFETAELYRKFGPHELPRMYKQQQLIICEALGRLAGGALIKPSDNILMAHTDEPLPSDRPVPSEFSAYASIPGTDLYRFRMSTLFKRLELHNRAKD